MAPSVSLVGQATTQPNTSRSTLTGIFTKARRGGWWISLALVFAAVLFGGMVRWTVPARVEDLRPRPDALEYEQAAYNLLHGDGYALVVNGKRYPPRYPPGFPAMIVPALLFAGDAPGTGVYAVLVCALVAILATAALAWRTGGPLSGAVAAWLVATAPLHVRWSRAVMSDVPASAAAALLTLSALRAYSAGRAFWWVAMGAGLGLATTIRSSLGLLAGPVALLLLFESHPRRARHLIALGTGMLVGFLPGALVAARTLGAPFANGYGIWVPGVPLIAWRYVTGPPAGGGTEPNVTFLFKALMGGGGLYTWPIAGLIVLGAAVATPRSQARPLVIVGLGFTVALTTLHAAFFWQGERFLLPLLPLLLALAAVSVGTSVGWPTRIGACGLVALGLINVFQSQSPFSPPDRPLGQAAALRMLATHVEPNAAVVVRAHSFLAARLLRDAPDRVWVPVGLDEHQAAVASLGIRARGAAHDDERWIQPPIDAQHQREADNLITALFKEGRPVYYVPITGYEVASQKALREALETVFHIEPVNGLPIFKILPRS